MSERTWDEDAEVVRGCLWTVGALVATFALIPWWAYVATVLWSWFVVERFGLPPLGWAEAFGLRLVVAMFSAHAAYPDDDDENRVERMKWRIAYAVAWPALALGLGAAARWFL